MQSINFHYFSKSKKVVVVGKKASAQLPCLAAAYVSPNTKRINLLTDARCVDKLKADQVKFIAKLFNDEFSIFPYNI